MGRAKKVGSRSFRFEHPPAVVASATIVGPKEGKGPLGPYFDTVLEDNYYGEKCWEKTESKLQEEAIHNAIRKASLTEDQVDFCLSSDLLNQCTASSFCMRNCSMAHLGLYSACAGFTEGLLLGAMSIDGGFCENVVVSASSHHDAAERQYRFPTELGTQRPPTAQWTVTGAGAVVLRGSGTGPRITYATAGQVMDMGLKEPYNMGAAMAPAAADTLVRHFQDTQRSPEYYDLILTGDLARVGSRILRDWLAERYGVLLEDRHQDCGTLMYAEEQDVHSGGSGLGASACVVSGYLLKAVAEGRYRRVLLAGTGSLHSPVTWQQGESIPCISHAVAIEV